MSKKRLLLIHPKTRSQAVGYGQTETWGVPPLALAYIAAFTPENWDVKIVDEYTTTLDLRQDADLVGITSYTCNATRAYELAGAFRARKVAVVMGGIHVSMMPEEALKYADSVVIGEAENVWGDVLRDLEHGSLKRRYVGERASLDRIPIPRRDLFSETYPMDVIQTARGCPFGCEFCSVTAFNGAQYRQRPAEDVLAEMSTLEKKIVYFTDDNFFGVSEESAARSRAICEGMIRKKMNKIWFTQTSVNIADDEEMLDLAAKSGCRAVFIGFESINAESLREMRKSVNLKHGVAGLAKAVKTIHRHGIAVIGAFIFGNDHDDEGVFHRTAEFIKCVGIDAPQFGFLTPFPGTRLAQRFTSEGRILNTSYPDDWDNYDTDHVTYSPSLLTTVDLVRGFDYAVRRQFGSKMRIWRQTIRTLIETRSIAAAMFVHSCNKDGLVLYDFDKKFCDAALGTRNSSNG